MQKLAIIGTGIAGMGCAHFLHRFYDITLFEKNNNPGGHTNTVYVKEGDKQIPIDTGFIVCNKENYPLLMRLFEQLNVPLKPSPMSFAAQVVHDDIEYCGSSLNLLFTQRKNIFSPRYIKFLLQLNRFNSQCLEILHNPELQQLSIQQYCAGKGYGSDLMNWYILPMASALWSTPPETSAHFPALSLVNFFKNHGFLGLHTQFQWFTVKGGSEVYKQKLIAPFAHKIRTGTAIANVQRKPQHVELTTEHGETLLFDKVIFASHADQTLHMLSDATEKEKKLLSPFSYQKNRATLHTDKKLMPRHKKAWSSWNYRTEKQNGQLVSSCTYWMNSLQQVSDKHNYFLTINLQQNIEQDKIIKEIVYEHPVFTLEAMYAQQLLPELNQNEQIYFCGSYFRYGFHEDAFRSAVELCESILKSDIWS